MDFEVYHKYPPGDPILVDKIVCHLKAQGIFDNFRKECLSDVDTKPAYQNLRQRVDGSVAGYLAGHKWKPDLNKNQLRESLRKYIQNGGFLEVGVERIVDQVVNPKIGQVFLPRVRDVVLEGLGLKEESDSHASDRPAINNHKPSASSSSTTTSTKSSSTFTKASSLTEIDDSEENATSEKEPESSEALEVKKEDESASEKVLDSGATVASEMELEPAIKTEESANNFETHIETRSSDSSDTRISGISDLTSVKSISSLRDLNASDDEDDDNDDAIVAKSVDIDDVSEVEKEDKNDDKLMTSANDDDIQDSLKSQQSSNSNYEKSYPYGFLSEFSTQEENVEIETDQIGTSVVECVTTSENIEEDSDGRESANSIAKNIEINYDSDSNGDHRKEIDLQQTTEVGIDYHDDNHDNNDVHDNNDEAENYYEESSRDLSSFQKEESNFEESQSEADIEKCDSISNEMKFSGNIEDETFLETEDESFKSQRKEKKIGEERKYRKEKERKHHSKHKLSEGHHDSSSGESRDDRKPRKSWHSTDKERQFRDGDSRSSSLEGKLGKGDDNLDFKHRRSRHDKDATYDQEEVSKSESVEKKEQKSEIEYHKERHSRPKERKSVSKEKSHGDEYEEAKFDQVESCVSESDEKNEYKEEVKYSYKDRHVRSRGHKTTSKEKTRDDVYKKETFDEEASKSESDEINKFQGKVEYSHKERHGRSRSHKTTSKEKAHVDEFEEETSVCESDEKIKYGEKVEYSIRERHSRSRDHKTASKDKTSDDEYEEEMFDQEEASKSESDDRKEYQDEDEYSRKERHTRSRDHKKATREKTHVDEYEGAAFDQEKSGKCESDEKSKHQEKVGYSHKGKHSHSRSHRTPAKERGHDDKYKEDARSKCYQEETGKSDSDDRKGYQNEDEYSHKERRTRSRDHVKAAKESMNVDEYERPAFDQEETSKGESDDKNKYQDEVEYSHKEKHSRSRGHKTVSKEIPQTDQYEEEEAFNQEEACKSESDERKECQYDVEYSYKERSTRSRGHKKAFKEKAHVDQYDPEEPSKCESNEKNENQENVEYSHKERHSRSRRHKTTSKEKFHDEYEEASFEQEEDEEGSLMELYEKKEFEDEVEYSHKEKKHTRSRGSINACKEKSEGVEYKEEMLDQEETSIKDSEERSRFHEKVESSHKERHSRSRDHRNTYKEKSHDDNRKHRKEEERHHRSDSDKKKHGSSSKRKHKSQDEIKEDRSHQSSSSHHRSSRDKHSRRQLEKCVEENQEIENNNDDNGRKDKDKGKKSRDNCKPADKSRDHRRSADGDSSGAADNRSLGSADSSRHTRSDRSKTKEKSGHKSGGKSSSSSTSDALPTSNVLEHNNSEQHNVEESVVNVSETIIQPSFQTIDPSMDDNGIFYIDKENSSCSDERFVSEEDGDSRICQERTETNEGENSINEEQGEKIIKLGTEKSANDVSKITMDIEIPEISNNKSEFQKESEFSTNNEQTNLDENLSSNEWAIEHVKNSESQEQINLVKGEEADKMVNNIDAKQEEKSNSGAESQEIYTSNPKSQSVFTLQNVETQVPKDGDTKVRKKRFAANIAEARKIMRERRRYEKKLQKKHLSLCDSSVIDQSSTMNQNVVCNQTEIEEKEIVEKNVECSNENSVPIPNVPNESTEFVEETAQNQDEVEINLKYKRPKLAANIYEVRKIIKARKRLRRMEKKRLNISKRGESSVNQQTVDGEFKTQFEDDEKHKIQNTINTTEAISTTCTRRQLGSKVAKIVLNKQDCDSKDAVNTVNDADNLITLKIKSQECLESGSENVECKSSLSYEDINQLASKCLVVKLNKLDDENLVKKENELANSIETSNQSDFQDVHANKELPLQDINKENILQFDSNYDSHEVGSHECRSENEKHDSLETITTEDQECGLYNESKCNAVMKVESMTNMTKTEIFDSDVTENLSSGKSTIDTIKFENSSTLETIGLADDVAGLVSGEKSQSVSIAAHVESSDSTETTAVVDDITKSNSNESKSVEVPEDEGFGASETIILEDNRTESHSCEKPKPVGEALNVEFGILETLGSGIDRIESNSFEKFTPVNKVESSSRVKTTVSGIVPDENDSSNGLTYPPKNESSSPSKIIFSGVDNSIEIVSKSPVEAPDVCKVIDSHKNIENEANNRISTPNEDSCFEKSFCYFEQNETDDSKERFEKFKLFLNAFEKDVKYLEDMEKTDLVTSDFALDRKFDSYLEKECGFQVLRKDCILLPSLNDENYYFDKESDCYYLKNRLVDKSEISNKNLNVHQQKLSDNNRKVLLSGRSSRSVGEKRSTRKKSVFQEQRKSPVKLRISIRNPNSSAIETEEINVPYTSDVESSIDGSAGRISVDSRKSVEDGVSENEPNNSDNPLRASTPLQDAESGTVQKPCDEISHSATSFKSTKRRRGHNRRKKSSNSPETVRCHQEFKIKTCPEAENNNLPSAEGAANLNSFKITLSRNNNSSNLSRIVAPQSPSSQSNTFLANNVPSSIDAAVPSESESRFIIGKRHSSKTDSFEESRRSPKKKYDSTFSDSDFKKTEQAIETVTDSLNNSLEDEADISHDESMTSNMIGEALKNLIAESGLVPTTPQLSSTKHETKEEPACARVTRHQRSQKKNDPPEDTERPVKRIRNSERLSAGVKLPRRYENTDFYKPRLDVGQGNRRKRKPDEPGLDSLVDNGPSRKRKLSNVVGPARRSSR